MTELFVEFTGETRSNLSCPVTELNIPGNAGETHRTKCISSINALEIKISIADSEL